MAMTAPIIIVHSYLQETEDKQRSELVKQRVHSVVIHPDEKPHLHNRDTAHESNSHHRKKWISLKTPQLLPHMPHVIICETRDQIRWIQFKYAYADTTKAGNNTTFPFIILLTGDINDDPNDVPNDGSMYTCEPDIIWTKNDMHVDHIKTMDNKTADELAVWARWWNHYEYDITLSNVRTTWMALQESVGDRAIVCRELCQSLLTVHNGEHKQLLSLFQTQKCETRQQLELLYWYIRVCMDAENVHQVVCLNPNSSPSSSVVVLKVLRTCILKTLEIHDFSKRRKLLKRWIDLLFSLPPIRLTEAKTEMWIINLQHRVDLKTAILRQIESLSLRFSIKFPEAVYGYQSIGRLHSRLHEKYPRAFPAITESSHAPLDLGEWGCWLTHVLIWEAIAGGSSVEKSGSSVEKEESTAVRNDDDTDTTVTESSTNIGGKLIVENRGVFGSIFSRDWPCVEDVVESCSEMIDLVWIGYHVENNARAEMILDTRVSSSAPTHLQLHPIQVMQYRKLREDSPMSVPVSTPLPILIGGTFGYYINPRGCRKLLEALQNAETQIVYPIDVWMMRHSPSSLIQYALYRPLIWNSYISKGGDIRSHKRNNH